jgi:hypothetical protein
MAKTDLLRSRRMDAQLAGIIPDPLRPPAVACRRKVETGRNPAARAEGISDKQGVIEPDLRRVAS